MSSSIGCDCSEAPAQQSNALVKDAQKALRQKHTCWRCGQRFMHERSLGRMLCKYKVPGVGSVSIDHCSGESGAKQLYVLFPLQLWDKLSCLCNERNETLHLAGSKLRRDWHPNLRGKMQTLFVGDTESAAQKKIVVRKYGAEEQPVEYELKTLYNECANLYGYDELEARWKKVEADANRPIGDAADPYATTQRELFDLNTVEDLCGNEFTDFVPFVVLFRVELQNIEIRFSA